MELTKGQIQNLREVLGDNLVDADIFIPVASARLLRCVFQGPPDPDLIGKYVFTDEKLKTMEHFDVPTFAIEIIRKTRSVFYSEEERLYGIALNVDDLFDIIGPPEADDGESAI